MNQHSFIERVRTSFQYLIDDYGFSVKDERYDPQSFGNSLVEFRSKETAIRLVLDRGQVLIDLGPTSMGSEFLVQSAQYDGFPGSRSR